MICWRGRADKLAAAARAPDGIGGARGDLNPRPLPCQLNRITLKRGVPKSWQIERPLRLTIRRYCLKLSLPFTFNAALARPPG